MSFFIPVVTLLLSMSALAGAQDLCNCSPVGYTFQIKLDSITCPPNPLDGFGPISGVAGFSCFNPGTGLPLRVTGYAFDAQDRDGNNIFGQSIVGGNFEDGGTLPSITYTNPDDMTTLVGGITLTVAGENQDGEVVVNTWSIQFTNECGVLPLEDGTEMGLVVFVSFLVLISNNVHCVWKLTDTSPISLCCCYSSHDSKILSVPQKHYAL